MPACVATARRGHGRSQCHDGLGPSLSACLPIRKCLGDQSECSARLCSARLGFAPRLLLLLVVKAAMNGYLSFGHVFVFQSFVSFFAVSLSFPKWAPRSRARCGDNDDLSTRKLKLAHLHALTGQASHSAAQTRSEEEEERGAEKK